MTARLSLPLRLAAPASPPRHRAALGLMVASGFAGLGYQIVWTQQAALWLGHEAAAVLAVVTAFFAGLGVGALVLGARIERSRRPQRWYAGCEGVMALWSVLLALALAPTSAWLQAITGVQPTPVRQWGVAFVGTFFMLLPATAAMGATLPAMERLVGAPSRPGQSIAALYAGNTFGAVVGVLATAFWLVPTLGLLRTAAICAALNLMCAAIGLRLPMREPAVRAPPRARSPWPWRLAATGMLGIGYEIVVVRVLSQVTEDTVYTFALLLAVYLLGSAGGAALYQRRCPTEMAARGRQLLSVQAAACLFGAATLWGAEHLQRLVVRVLGSSMTSALAAEAVMALAAFGLPTLVMGALFSHLCVQARAGGHAFGTALGFNTLGAAVAPLLMGVVLVPTLGAGPALILIAAGYLALALPTARREPLAVATAVATVLMALAAPPLVFVTVPPGGQLLSYREGAMAAVSVVADAHGVARLHINNRQQEGSSATLLADARQAWLPLLLHPSPTRALFLGLGTGVTASSAAGDSALRVDAVELLPEVIEASTHFIADPRSGAANAGLRIVAADARRFVSTTADRYDVIVADNYHPARSGSGALYTVEHFDAVRARLSAEGVFCQWLPLHQLDLDTLRSIVRSFLVAYPQGAAMLSTNSLETPVLGLVGRREGAPPLRADIARRLARSTQPLAALGITDEFALWGGFVAGAPSLSRFAGAAPLNTDDRPVVAYRAPRITYAPDSLPRERLSALLREWRVEPAEVVDAGPDAAWRHRLAAYWRARDRFIDVGQGVRASADARQMLAQVREPLLAVLRISPDFRPAYDPLLRLAGASDKPTAEALLRELTRLQPARTGAHVALRQLERDSR